MKTMKTAGWIGLAALSFATATATAAPVYSSGTSSALASCPTCVVGTHLIGGPLGSVAGTGGSGLSVSGSFLDGQRTYIYDQTYPGYAPGASVTRGAPDFAMMIWDMGIAMNTMRLYTHQDHYGGGPINDAFTAQDVMEYSVWGSNDGNTFFLLSDVIGFTLNGGGAGLPTYTFLGTEPSFVYRGGSAEFGAVNAYTRDYTFASNYRYYGVRSSWISKEARDADPEIDAIVGNPGPINQVPEPGTLTLLGIGVLALAGIRRRFR